MESKGGLGTLRTLGTLATLETLGTLETLETLGTLATLATLGGVGAWPKSGGKMRLGKKKDKFFLFCTRLSLPLQYDKQEQGESPAAVGKQETPS